MQYLVQKNNRTIQGTITLDGSKSISNRALIIRALSGKDFQLHRLANAKDTETLVRLLSQKDSDIYDAGPAGTTYRFMTAYLAMQEGTQVLTGSERMKERPIGVLVDALVKLGADIEYLEKDGYPPLKINSPKKIGTINHLSIPASVSSQYISALLMIAPLLPNGLSLALTGKIVSRPYIQMTLNLMKTFGIQSSWTDATITIEKQEYVGKDFVIEGDWSAASYYYALAALSEGRLDLQLDGLFPDSVQGDAVVTKMATLFGIQSTFNDNGVQLTAPNGIQKPSLFEWNFLECPDIAQTLAVWCGGLGVQGLFTGLETLKIKETDRVAALNIELGKVGCYFGELPSSKFSPKTGTEYYMVEGETTQPAETPLFDTYHDHRQAMAFVPLAMIVGDIIIDDPNVVEKSYPAFWEDFKKLGFNYQTI